MEAFARARREAFAGRMVEKLLLWDEEYGRQRTPEDRARFVQLGIARAVKYGIDSQYALELFLQWMAESGEDFPEQPEFSSVRDMLSDEALPPNARLELAWQMRDRPQWDDWDGDPDPEANPG